MEPRKHEPQRLPPGREPISTTLEHVPTPAAEERLARAYRLILGAAAGVGLQNPSAEGISTSMDREDEEEA